MNLHLLWNLQHVVMINGFFLLQILQGLQSEDTSVRAPWTDREIKSLVQYIALFCDLGEDCEWVEKPLPHKKSTSLTVIQRGYRS